MIKKISAAMLKNACYALLKKYFRRQPYYADLIDLFHETGFHCGMAEMNKHTFSPPKSHDFSKFSAESYQQIVASKTSFSSFYLPVAAAMRIMGITSPIAYCTARSLCLVIGEYAQYQEDYLDCYGDPDMGPGKRGTHIRNGQMSWTIVKALEVCTPEQARILYANYGRNSYVAETQVKNVYQTLNIPDHFAEYEETATHRILALIEAIPEKSKGGLKRDIFLSIFQRFRVCH